MRSSLIVLLLSLVSATAHALTVDDAIKLALSRSHGNVHERQLAEQAQAAHDTALSVRSRMLFSLHAGEELQRYNCPYGVSLTLLVGACVDDLPADPNGVAPLIERNATTNTFVVSADQPVLGLLRLHQDYVAQARNADSIAESVNADDARLVESVRNGFLRYFEAVAAEGVAKDSEAELAEQVQVALAREKNGVITIADRLRVQVALANAHQQRVAAHAEAEIARTNVLDTVGLSTDDDSIVLEEPAQLLAEAAQPMPARAAAARDAETRRPEIRQAEHAYESAVAAHRSRVFAMLPDVDLEAAYTRIDGEILSPKSSWFVGINAQWTFWAWGADYFAQRSAAHQETAAELALEDQKRQIAVGVHTAFANLDAATAAVDAAQQAIDSANEAYRVTAELAKAGTATTTDLLNAESELTTARLNLSRSRYEQAMTRVTLRRLTGD
jgi:outer membrane protein TolC